MSRKGENIYKRKDGRWEGRYVRCYDENERPKYGYVYAKTYTEAKNKLRPLAAVLAVVMLAIGCGAVKPVHAETQTSAMLANAIGLDGQEITITSIDEDLPSGICDDGSFIVNLNDAEDGQPFVIGAASDGLCSDSDTMPTVQPNGFIAPIDEPPVEGSIAISTAKQLYDIRSNSTGNYHLENDIDVSDLAELDITWAMIPSYNGIFDGQGHTIYGLNDPLFKGAQGTIKNLGADVCIDNNSTYYSYYGAIVCVVSGGLSIENCKASGVICADRNSIGGIIGYSSDECIVTSSIIIIFCCMLLSPAFQTEL